MLCISPSCPFETFTYIYSGNAFRAPVSLLRCRMTLPPGYHYANDTKFADLSGKSCEGKDFECVPFEDGSADLIIILHVLEHILPLDVPLRHLARIAKPGVGMMQIEVPCSPDAPTRLCRNEGKSALPFLSGKSNLSPSLRSRATPSVVLHSSVRFFTAAISAGASRTSSVLEAPLRRRRGKRERPPWRRSDTCHRGVHSYPFRAER